MSSFLRFIPATLLVLYLAAKVAPYLQEENIDPSYTPTAQQQVMLAPVSASLKPYPEAANDFASLYYGMALVVGADEVILKTTGDVRLSHENAGALAIQAGEIPRIPGYAEAVNNFIVAEVGRDNVPLDAVKRKQIIDTFKALAWATNQ
tara:strand:- start:602 stop:1048 length:447 start_codon:yes stop_codon:yes gene_type:complete